MGSDCAGADVEPHRGQHHENPARPFTTAAPALTITRRPRDVAMPGISAPTTVRSTAVPERPDRLRLCSASIPSGPARALLPATRRAWPHRSPAGLTGRRRGAPLTVRQLAASTGRESGRQALGAVAPAADAGSPINGRRRGMPLTIASPVPSLVDFTLAMATRRGLRGSTLAGADTIASAPPPASAHDASSPNE